MRNFDGYLDVRDAVVQAVRHRFATLWLFEQSPIDFEATHRVVAGFLGSIVY